MRGKGKGERGEAREGAGETGKGRWRNRSREMAKREGIGGMEEGKEGKGERKRCGRRKGREEEVEMGR